MVILHIQIYQPKKQWLILNDYNTDMIIAEQALEFAQTILKKVGVFFDDIFQWIGDIVNWDTIIRYKKAISYYMTILPILRSRYRMNRWEVF